MNLGASGNTVPGYLLNAPTNMAGVVADLQKCVATFLNPTTRQHLVESRIPLGVLRHRLLDVQRPPDPERAEGRLVAGDGNSVGCDSSYGYSYGCRATTPAAANVAMADGSVRFLKDLDLSRPTLWGLGTKSGAEVISSDSY